MRRITKKDKRDRRRQAVRETERELFSPKERLIYRFKECGKVRAVDPIRVTAELAAADPSLDFLIKTITLPTPDAGKNVVLAAGIIRRAFGCVEEREHDGHIIGMTDGDCLALFNDFVMWIEDIKKKFGIQDSLPFAMLSDQVGLPESSLPTPNMPGSTSVRTEFSLGSPSQQPSPLQSVLEKPQSGFMTP